MTPTSDSPAPGPDADGRGNVGGGGHPVAMSSTHAAGRTSLARNRPAHLGRGCGPRASGSGPDARGVRPGVNAKVYPAKEFQGFGERVW